ncbi:hypothetical protein [Nitratireductor indicus]|uniref:hypothetical protein n=1 Tax=Nitratireductor indicus TaxID=721133 RepID=UPI002875AAC5|nr:hypothetical protein [Nitratireductor indicus]MDS1138611.1 hypothetical protein [Nitratireductor indicus]
MGRKFNRELTEEERSEINQFSKAIKDYVDLSVTDCVETLKDIEAGYAKNIVSHILLENAARIAMSAARDDFAREPRKNYWSKACREAFDRALKKSSISRWVVTFEEIMTVRQGD